MGFKDLRAKINELGDEAKAHLSNLVPGKNWTQLTTDELRHGLSSFNAPKATSNVVEENATVEEINEVLDVYKTNNMEKIINEVGDLLFACVNVSRLLNVDEEEALTKSTKKFIKRFGFIEDNVLKQGKDLKSVTLDEMNSLWETSKKYD